MAARGIRCTLWKQHGDVHKGLCYFHPTRRSGMTGPEASYSSGCIAKFCVMMFPARRFTVTTWVM
jgi:hypothetical protein